MATTTTEFCESLVSNCPELKELLAEHISDCDELLPNVFLGEITRYVLMDGKGRCRIVGYFNESFSSGEPDPRRCRRRQPQRESGRNGPTTRAHQSRLWVKGKTQEAVELTISS